MKFGVREICDVVLRAKGTVKVGETTFSHDEPVIYFDSAKTSTVEGSATTVYATGGRGNNKLLAWEGEKSVTFTMEDALLSPLGFSILSGAGLVDAAKVDGGMKVHTTLTTVVDVTSGINVNLAELTGKEIAEEKAYAFIMKDGQIVERLKPATPSSGSVTFTRNGKASGPLTGEQTVMVDFYVKVETGAVEMTIEPDKFGGFYYLEASTLFRRQDNGQDMAAAFVIPKVKIQSNFTFSMASSGDPSTFTFTMDAFPDYTKFDPTKQVLFALQIIE
jgi:hypothetical protein